MVSASAAVSGLVLNCAPYKYPLTNSARSAALVMEKSSFNLLTAIVSPLYVHLTDKLSLSYTYIIPHPLPQSQISTYTILHRNLKNKYIYSIINIEKEKEIMVSMEKYINQIVAIDTILNNPPDAHYPVWFAEQIGNLRAADVTKIIKRLREIRNSIDWYNAIFNGHTSAAIGYTALLEAIAGKRYAWDLDNMVLNGW